MAHVPIASPTSITATVVSSSSRYGRTANAHATPSPNDSRMFIVIAYFPAMSLYAGLAKFTIVVTMVAAIIKISSVVCIGAFYKVKTSEQIPI